MPKKRRDLKKPGNPKKPRFQYRRRDPAHLAALVRRHRFDEDFKKALADAHKREPARLCELLRSGEPLSDEHRAALAELIERYVQLKEGRGRPPGVAFMGRVRQLEHDIAESTRKELARLRNELGVTRLPSGTIDQVMRKIAEQVGENYDGDLPDLNKISFDNILNEVKRGAKPSR